jgi:hypothetical protein
MYEVCSSRIEEAEVVEWIEQSSTAGEYPDAKGSPATTSLQNNNAAMYQCWLAKCKTMVREVESLMQYKIKTR